MRAGPGRTLAGCIGSDAPSEATEPLARSPRDARQLEQARGDHAQRGDRLPVALLAGAAADPGDRDLRLGLRRGGGPRRDPAGAQPVHRRGLGGGDPAARGRQRQAEDGEDRRPDRRRHHPGERFRRPDAAPGHAQHRLGGQPQAGLLPQDPAQEAALLLPADPRRRAPWCSSRSPPAPASRPCKRCSRRGWRSASRS